MAVQLKYKLRISGASQVVAVCDKKEKALFGAAMKDIVIYQVPLTLIRSLFNIKQ